MVIYDGAGGEQLVRSLRVEVPYLPGGRTCGVRRRERGRVVAAGTGGGLRVALSGGNSVRPGRSPTQLTNDSFVSGPVLRYGVFVAAGDPNGASP